MDVVHVEGESGFVQQVIWLEENEIRSVTLLRELIGQLDEPQIGFGKRLEERIVQHFANVSSAKAPRSRLGTVGEATELEQRALIATDAAGHSSPRVR